MSIPENNIIAGIYVPPQVMTFSFSRSSGPGGQNVNKLNTKAELVIDLELLEPALTTFMVERLKQILGINDFTGKTVRLVNQTERSQLANKQACVEKFRRLLVRAQTRPKKRIPTRTPRGVIQRRLDNKKRNAQRKANRKWTPDD